MQYKETSNPFALKVILHNIGLVQFATHYRPQQGRNNFTDVLVQI